MKVIHAISVFALLGSAAPAFAQSYSSDTPSGFRVEVLGGYDNVGLDLTALGKPTPAPAPKPGTKPTTGSSNRNNNDVSGSGFTYGGRIGYDIPVSDGLAFGIDVEAFGSTAKKKFNNKTFTGTYDVGRDLYVGGRITGAVSDGINLYAMAGYTNARFERTSSRVANTRVVTRDNVDRSGFRIGAGAQFALTQNAFATTEYRYSNYSGGYSRHQVLAGVGFRF